MSSHAPQGVLHFRTIGNRSSERRMHGLSRCILLESRNKDYGCRAVEDCIATMLCAETVAFQHSKQKNMVKVLAFLSRSKLFNKRSQNRVRK